jgi:uncharacterized protein YbjT (DUF2867 family)
MRIQAIITGVTGMVGEGVLQECLNHPQVDKVLVISRRPSGIVHPKVSEVIHSNFHDVSAIENRLKGYNACFFCLGVSSVGMKEDEYRHLTYDLTLHVAKTLCRLNLDMTFCYVSGAGTSSSESGAMWARVKGRTENELLKLPFKGSYMFRPAVMRPTPGLKNTLKGYTYFAWMLPGLQKLFPNYVCSLRDVGQAMINAVSKGYPKRILEVSDIVSLAQKK